ncbi:MAG: hypothetical protein OQL09_07940 [Gammaproteobacteria bacterium]|nr:hypothetical protein [Gammaproteobacteria bacterium]
MSYNFTNQVSSEHQCLLDLCDQIDGLLKSMSDTNEVDYQQLQDQVQKLRYLLINIHLPKDRVLTDSFKNDHDNKQWIRLLMDYQSSVALKTLSQLDEIINRALMGQLVSKTSIITEGKEAIHQVRSAISFEEHICLPYVEKNMSKHNWFSAINNTSSFIFHCK